MTVTSSGDLDLSMKFWHHGGVKLVYSPDSAVPKLQDRLGSLADIVGLGETFDLGMMLDDLAPAEWAG